MSIVLVEDDPGYADLVSEGLRSGWPGALDLVRVARLADARQRLAEDGADCVLLDLSLPDAFGLEALSGILEAAGDAPVVVLTGRDEEDDLGTEAVRLGAQDYLVKGRVTDEVITRAVRYAIERKRAQLDRAALQAEYAREASIATELQRGLIRELPAVPGLELAVRYEPSGPEDRVGGDWYDVIALPDGRVIVAVGDVTGHGLPVASTMGQLASSLRAFALTDPAPTPLLEALNDVLVFYAPDQFATLVYVLVDLRAGTARMASAGHPPAVLLRADGGAELLPGGRGVLLGFTPSRIREAEVALGPGDALVLYTDGLVERRGEALDGGLERLRTLAEGSARQTAEMLADRIGSGLSSGGAREDDATVLVVRRTS